MIFPIIKLIYGHDRNIKEQKSRKKEKISRV